MRFRWKLGILLALMPAAIEAVEVRDDLPFANGRYAQEADCNSLQNAERKGEPRSLNNSAWHLTKDGFSDGWEAGCSFHAVFMRGQSATATAICGEGAVSTIEHYYFEQGQEPAGNPDIFVYRKGDKSPEAEQGITYSWCPIVKPNQ